MSIKKIIPYINAENEAISHVIQLVKQYSESGADEILLYNYSKDEKSREEFINLAKELNKGLDIPLLVGCYVRRMEDIKKVLYTGADSCLIKYSQLEDKQLLAQASERFSSDKLMIEVDMSECIESQEENLFETIRAYGAGKLLLKHVKISDQTRSRIENSSLPIIIRDSLQRNDIFSLISMINVVGVATNFYENKDIMKAKSSLKQEGIAVNIYESSLPFSEFKLNSDGLIPVITQDYKTGEVLMLAYMNEEAYNKTIAGGRMTYFSRERKALWLKGETSGHFQFLMEMKLDCDKDTLLAKVRQLGAACHTGNSNCFFTSLLEREYKNSSPYQVFEEVFSVILDRRRNPKEGSYTNYLFDKGIDKILKKCGEEAAEIIIAAKNPGSEELRYEIADYLYHLMVLMAECGLDWKDITEELANRK